MKIFSTVFLLGGLAAATPAAAGDLAVGVGAAMAMDMPDKVSAEYARFGPGASLQIPVRYNIAPNARIRATARADFGTGTDRVTWGHVVNGEEQRFYDDDHFAMFVSGGLTVGPEVVIPTSGSVAPYFGAEGGIAWIGTYHSLSGDTQLLLDPEQNDLTSTGNVDPSTSQAAFLTDLHAGAMTGGDLGAWFELGYSMAFVGERDLSKTPAELNAKRSAYGWNAIRVGAGVSFTL